MSFRRSPVPSARRTASRSQLPARPSVPAPGRAETQVALTDAYAKANGFSHDPSKEPEFSEYLELDLADVVPSIAGPKRPQDRIALSRAQQTWRNDVSEYVEDVVDESVEESFPASDSPAHSANGDRPHKPVPVTLADGTETEIDHGAVVIAAITSCTNTSNPSVMLGAALLAKNAVEKGLTRKPWVKTSLAPGSKVVTDYYERSGLTPYLDKLGFNLVGYGCTTCIGNSGPLPEEISRAGHENDLAVQSVLARHRKFAGRFSAVVQT